MRKLIKVLALCLLVTALLGFSSAYAADCPNCTNALTAGSPVPATCSAQGYTPYSCGSCGYSTIGDLVNPTSHSHTVPSTVVAASTCSTQGSQLYKCSGCTDTITLALPLNPANHENVTETLVTPASCLAPGSIKKACTACGTDLGTVPTALADHSLVKDTGKTNVAATCTTDGTEYYKCSVAGCSYTVSKTIKAFGHAMEWVDNKDGTHTYVCQNDAKHFYCHQYHQYTPWKILLHNTETSDGYRIRWCDNCGATQKDTIKAGVPLTGDSSNIALYAAVALAALGGIGCVLVYAKKKAK